MVTEHIDHYGLNVHSLAYWDLLGVTNALEPAAIV